MCDKFYGMKSPCCIHHVVVWWWWWRIFIMEWIGRRYCVTKNKQTEEKKRRNKRLHFPIRALLSSRSSWLITTFTNKRNTLVTSISISNNTYFDRLASTFLLYMDFMYTGNLMLVFCSPIQLIKYGREAFYILVS